MAGFSARLAFGRLVGSLAAAVVVWAAMPATGAPAASPDTRWIGGAAQPKQLAPLDTARADYRISDLRWSGWNSAGAVGTGTAEYFFKADNHAGTPTPVVVTMTRATTCFGDPQLFYTSYTAALAEGASKPPDWDIAPLLRGERHACVVGSGCEAKSRCVIAEAFRTFAASGYARDKTSYRFFGPKTRWLLAHVSSWGKPVVTVRMVMVPNKPIGPPCGPGCSRVYPVSLRLSRLSYCGDRGFGYTRLTARLYGTGKAYVNYKPPSAYRRIYQQLKGQFKGKPRVTRSASAKAGYGCRPVPSGR